MENILFLSLLALAPILTIGFLLVGLRWPAVWAMPVGYVVVVIIGLFVWQLSFASIAASTVQGLIIALTILYIVFGALLLLATLSESGACLARWATLISLPSLHIKRGQKRQMSVSRDAKIYPGLIVFLLVTLTLLAGCGPSQSGQQQASSESASTQDDKMESTSTNDTMEPTSGTPMAGMRPAEVSSLTGFYGGQEVRFIHTEVSDKEEANRMTGMGGSQLLFVPSLDRMPEEALANVYVFTNGVSGSGAKGFQLDVFDSAPGDTGYTPLRNLELATWKDGGNARVLKSAANIKEAEKNGALEIEEPGIVFNMPFMNWPGGKR